MSVINLTWEEVGKRAENVARALCDAFPKKMGLDVYPVPRGGIPAALAVQSAMVDRGCATFQIPLKLVEHQTSADIIIDDIIDSGVTRKRFGDLLACRLGAPFYALVDKPAEGITDWVEFPWERMNNEQGPEENVRRLIEFIGDDPNREGLRETPARVIRSYEELLGGYKQKPEDVVKVFEDDDCDEMVIVRDIEFVSTCEHHMLPFMGKAHIAYIPDGKVIGVSKLVRVLEVFSRRLQIQERLCEQVTKALDDILKPKGSACVLEAKHLCMTARGVRKQGSVMVTSSLTGVFREQGNMARQEFLGMIR